MKRIFKIKDLIKGRRYKIFYRYNGAMIVARFNKIKKNFYYPDQAYFLDLNFGSYAVEDEDLRNTTIKVFEL